MRKIIGIGETILDIIFKNGQPTKALPGGSVFNTMVSLGRLGIPVHFITELGQDQVGNNILSFMRENNLSTENVDIFCEGKSPVSLAFLNDQNEARYMFYTQYPENRLNVIWPRIDPDDILILGSYYAVNPSLRYRITEFLEYAHERKAIIYYDPTKPCASLRLYSRISNMQISYEVRKKISRRYLIFQIRGKYISTKLNSIVLILSTQEDQKV